MQALHLEEQLCSIIQNCSTNILQLVLSVQKTQEKSPKDWKKCLKTENLT